MSIPVTCACGRFVELRDEAGQSSCLCPVCGRPVTVPHALPPECTVFISHSAEDKTVAEAVCTALEARGFRCWIAPRDILPGKDWSEAIIEGISQSQVMVLVFSSRSNESVQVRRELERATAKGLTLVPFRIEDTPMSKALEYFLCTAQWLDAFVPPLRPHLDVLVASVSQLLGASRDAAPPRRQSVIPFQADRLPDPFVGREAETEALKALVRQNDVVVLRGGLGGIGKSALASKVAHELRSEFPHGVLWLRVDEGDADSRLVTLLASLDEHLVERARELNTQAKANLYSSQMSVRKALVILDNAETFEQLEHLIPAQGDSRFLVTTRHAIRVPGAREFRVEVLQSEAAAHLLWQLAGCRPRDNWQAMLPVADTLGGLPLALQMAAGVMRDLDWTPTEYLHELQSGDPFSWLEDPELALGVKQSFALSYDKLAADIKPTFRVLGAMAREAMPVAAIAAASGQTKAKASRDLMVLVRRGLVDEASQQASIRIHPLMAEYARWLLPAAEAICAHQRLGQWYLAEISLWDQAAAVFRHGEDATDHDLECGMAAVRHFLQATDTVRAHDVLVGIADPLTRTGRDRFLFSCIHELSEKMPLGPWLRLYRDDFVLNASYAGDEDAARADLEEITHHEDRKVASAAVICLAKKAYRDHRIDEAEQLFLQSKELKLQCQPQDLKGVAYLLNELARIRLARGHDAAEALSLHREALQCQEEANDKKGIAHTLRRIATLQLRRLNDPLAALRALQRAELAARKCGSTFTLIQVLLEMAEAQRRRSLFHDAIATLNRALQLATESNDAFAEVHVLKRLYKIYEDVEFLGDALHTVDRALQMRAAASFFEQHDLSQLENARQRLSQKTDELRKEAQEIESAMRRLEAAMEAQTDRSSASGKAKLAETRSELRVLRKRRKRILQRLGEIPAQVRLGKRQPNGDDLS